MPGQAGPTSIEQIATRGVPAKSGSISTATPAGVVILVRRIGPAYDDPDE